MKAPDTRHQVEVWEYPLGLFDAIGVELEYMIVDRETLDVRPVADRLFSVAAGHETSDVEPDGPAGVVSWSNELALHIAEMKTARPVASLDGLDNEFQRHVHRMNELLEPMGCCLLPTGMHPWMHPDTETRLWPHENNEVYATYDRIFGCRGHGWGNLQSTHINLPFRNDDEFGRLHAAIRLVLPLLPGLAASSPIADGDWMPIADYRLDVYRRNSARVPMMTGTVIPEPIFSRGEYEREILGRLFADLLPLDPEGILHHEWANARGAIARFDRGSIEIRLLDIQECPAADVAIVALVTEVVRGLVEERWIGYEDQKRISTEALHTTLLDSIRYAEYTRIRDRSVLSAYGINQSMALCSDVWQHLLELVMPNDPARTPILRKMLQSGTLSTRIGKMVRRFPTKDEIRSIYRELADCLQQGKLFHVG